MCTCVSQAVAEAKKEKHFFKIITYLVSFLHFCNFIEHTSYHGNKSNASVDSLKDPREPNTCGICGRTMMNLKEVAKHILNVHQGE